ncbi:MAG: ParB N-terminal domain-containing protein [Oscillospiraceae bacterium]|jgi:site-specific DNA-methyltransferase (adenine-specific)|nr:ParB N-terminal domain-containing protein [Oscillospiraceae bacterium]
MRKYENIAIEKLKPYEKNARTHSDEQISKIAKSIEEFGFINPVLIDADLGIIAGHCRVLAAKQIGMKEVPCLFVEDLSETQKRAYIIADNKLALDADWDFDILKIELEDLKNLDFDISLTGFDDFNFGLDSKEITDDDFDSDEINEILEEEPKSKLDDVYKLGEHLLMCGDSTVANDVSKLMKNENNIPKLIENADNVSKLMDSKPKDKETADLLVTDPPYNVDYKGKTKERIKILNDNQTSEEFRSFLISAFKNADKYLKSGGAFYIWFGNKETLSFYQACQEVDWEIRQQLIWNKNALVLGRQDYQWKHEPCIYGWKSGDSHYFIDDRTQTTILEFDKPLKNEEHPTMKPVLLIAKLIENSSKKDEIVLDLFGGSGTTLIACEQLNRKCRMMELDPRYCDVIIKRWENLTGKKAELISN